MADKTGIRWTEATWNPVAGCSIESPACTNCYAMEMAARIVRMERTKGHVSHYEGTTVAVKGAPVWSGKLVVAPEHIFLKPARWTKPRMIFVNSMSDVFHPDMPLSVIDEIFAVMRIGRRHVYQVLTKRPGVMRAYMSDPATPARITAAARLVARKVDPKGRIAEGIVQDESWPPSNVWTGSTVEDQRRAEERLVDLLGFPSRVRFVSVEPMLSSVRLREVKVVAADGSIVWFDALDASRAGGYGPDGTPFLDVSLRPCVDGVPVATLDWVIVGGESGPNARPMHPIWAAQVRDDCAEAGTAYFFKQWGAFTATSNDPAFPEALGPAERIVSVEGGTKGSHLVVMRRGRQVEGVDEVQDGRIHQRFPEAASHLNAA